MRKEMRIILIFIFAIIFSNLVFAVCDENQLIMRLSDNNNAHGEISSQNNYNIDICFNDFFVSNYPADSTVHDCRSGDSSLVLKLSSETNAHAEVKSGTKYNSDNTKICYGDLQCLDVNSAECPDGYTFIVGLSGETNAHITSDFSNDNYPVKICCRSSIGPICGNGNIDEDNGEVCDGDNVGEITCQDISDEFSGGTLRCADDCHSYDTSDCIPIGDCTGNTCGDGRICPGEECEKNPLDLSGNDCESDIFHDAFSGGTLNCDEECQYDTSDCTENSLTEGVYWANTEGDPITEAQTGDQVKMVYELEGIENRQVEFSIYKQGELSWNPFNWFDRKIASNIGAETSWLAGKNSAGAYEEGNYYFTVNIDGTEISSNEDIYDYGVLTVTRADNEDNAMPVAEIVKPLEYSRHLAGSNINFEQNSKDEDDQLTIIWDFGDGTNQVFHNYYIGGNINANVSHVYQESGPYEVTLTAQEETRDQEDSITREIYIYSSGINLFPIISEPNVDDEEVYTSQDIRFNASSSYVSNCTECNLISDKYFCSSCASGETCYNITEDERVQCYDFKKSAVLNGYNLWFNWTFDEGPHMIGNWNNNYNSVVEFTRSFITIGEHWARLKLGYEKV